MSDHERLTVSVEEAAALLGISRALAELMRKDELPRLQLGRRVVVPPDLRTGPGCLVGGRRPGDPVIVVLGDPHREHGASVVHRARHGRES